MASHIANRYHCGVMRRLSVEEWKKVMKSWAWARTPLVEIVRGMRSFLSMSTPLQTIPPPRKSKSKEEEDDDDEDEDDEEKEEVVEEEDMEQETAMDGLFEMVEEEDRVDVEEMKMEMVSKKQQKEQKQQQKEKKHKEQKKQEKKKIVKKSHDRKKK